MHHDHPLVAHGAGEVDVEQAHALEGEGDLHPRVLILAGGADDLLLHLGEGEVGDAKEADGRDERMSLGIYGDPNGLVEFSPDVELEHVARADEVGVGIDLLVLADDLALHVIPLGQA